MPDSPSTSTSTTHETKAATKSAAATDVCGNCGELRGNAPEGVHDVHSAWALEGVNAGDPKWTQDYCWRCGAKY